MPGQVSSAVARLAATSWALKIGGFGLIGTVPAEVGARLTALAHVDLSSNSLSGSLPPTFFRRLRSLVYIDMSNNAFNGPLPALPAVQFLNLTNSGW